MADRRDEILMWLRKHDREFVVALGEESGWWTAEDVDATIDAAAGPAARPAPDHRPPITPARPRPRNPDAPPAIAAVTLEAPDGQRGTLIGPASKIAAVVRPDAVIDQHDTFGTNRGVVIASPAALAREAQASVALDGQTFEVTEPVPDPPASVTVDVGEVVPDVNEELVDQVDVGEPAPADAVHPADGGDVLAAGLAHPDPRRRGRRTEGLGRHRPAHQRAAAQHPDHQEPLVTMRTVYTATPLYPGFFMPEDGARHDVADAGLSTALAAIGDDGLWFCIEVRTVMEKRWTDGLGEERWLPDGPAVSHRIYVGDQFHVDELQHDLAGDRLRSNAEAYGADRLVLTRRTNWQPLRSSDVVLTVDELADELARAQA